MDVDGILEEGEEVLTGYKGSPALDAGLIAAAQAVEHYEIARYGALIAWAEQLGHSEAAELLTVTLGEEMATDEALAELGDGGVNDRAMAEARSPVRRVPETPGPPSIRERQDTDNVVGVHCGSPSVGLSMEVSATGLPISDGLRPADVGTDCR